MAMGNTDTDFHRMFLSMRPSCILTNEGDKAMQKGDLRVYGPTSRVFRSKIMCLLFS